MSDPMILHGTRCIVRPWRVNDAESLARHANNINIAKHLRDRFPHPYTSRDAHEFLKMITSTTAQTNLAIEVNGEAAGGLGYVPGNDVERYSAEVGYWLGETCWGRGVVTEALTLFTDHAFKELRVLRLFALPFADNVSSIRVLEKAGYEREGILRSSSVKYGKPRDQAIYAKVNPDWYS
jgi:[ribosomal protein S5]-alanine N-acetyltransferase